MKTTTKIDALNKLLRIEEAKEKKMKKLRRKDHMMGKLLNRKLNPTGKTRTIKLVWFQDGATPTVLHPGEGFSRERLEKHTPIVEIEDRQQIEVRGENGTLWIDSTKSGDITAERI